MAYYSTNLFTTKITDEIFGDGDDYVAICWQNILVTSMAIPATLHAMSSLKSLGTKRLQLWGFMWMSGAFFMLGILWKPLSRPGLATIARFVIYLNLFASLNWGPNVSSFVLPQEVFDVEIRSTFNGIAAAAGKSSIICD